ncbi:MAG: M3 family oligoendopeptidase [Acidobacteriota bacterium]
MTSTLTTQDPTSTTDATTPEAIASSPSSDWQIDRWDLSELLPEPTDAVVEARLQDVDALVETLEAARSELEDGPTPERLLELIALYEQIEEKIHRLAGYASLWFSSDTQDSAAVSFRNRMQQETTRLGNRVLFFGLWWKGLPDAEAEALLPDAAEHGDQRHFLKEMRRFTPFTLEEKVEQAINLKDANGIGGVLTLYSMLKNRLEFEIEVEGETRTLTEEQMRAHFFSPDPELRERTYRTLFATYEDQSTVLAQIYANRVRDWHNEYVDLRGFGSPIAVRNLWNDVSDQAVDVLLDVVAGNAGTFQDYFRLKAGWLGMDRLRRFDVYAPLAASQREIPFSDAVTSVLDTFRAFEPRLATLCERVFRERHIDSGIRKGKRGGAFCSTVSPNVTPYVHLNYTGRMRDVSTLAHELGHAMHSMLSEHRSILVQHPPLPLAETASVFAEMLVTDRLLAQETDPLARRELLATAVDDIYATVLRQAFFVRFERDAHAAVVGNRSADDLYALYLTNLQEQFGDSLEIAEEFRYEFLAIPHIFATPFYCYAYSFGQLLVLALYRRYQQEGEAFIPGYLRLLGYGGSKSPAEALEEIDIDIADPGFWQGGFEVVRSMIDELAELRVEAAADS